MLWNIVNSLSYGNNHLFLKGEESCHITQVLIKVKSLEYAQFMRHTFKFRIWILKMKEICCCYLSFISKSCSGGAGKRPQKRRPAVVTVSELCGFSLNRHISFCTLSTRRVLWWSLDYLHDEMDILSLLLSCQLGKTWEFLPSLFSKVCI